MTLGEWRRLPEDLPSFDSLLPPPRRRHAAPKEHAMTAVAQVAKAITAAVAGASASVVTAAQDGTVTGAEWVTVIAAAVVAGYAVYRIPNASAE